MQERLEHRQCTTCKEAWPTRQNLTSETYTMLPVQKRQEITKEIQC